MGDYTPDNSVQNGNGTEIGGAHYGLNTAKNISWNKATKREENMQPIIKTNEPQAEPIWLFLNIDPYGFELSDSESWECLERIVKDKEFKVKPVFLTKGKTEREINERLHIKA